MTATGHCQLSVILPCANERDNLEPLIQELETELRGLNAPFEIIVVDDGSTDASFELLRSLQPTRPWLRAFQHRRNFGQSACYCTGFKLAQGELVITMDADRQHDPADIKRMLRELKDDVAAVCGIRAGRKDTWVRRWSSKLANGFASWAIGDQVVDAGCTFRIIRRTALAELPVFNGLHRFLPTLLRYQGYQVVRVNINHRDRSAGVSKYGIGNRLWRGLVDCLGIRWYHKRCLPANRLPARPNPLPEDSQMPGLPVNGSASPVTGDFKGELRR